MKLDKINVFCAYSYVITFTIPIKSAKINSHENYVSTKSAKINPREKLYADFPFVVFLQKTDDFERIIAAHNLPAHFNTGLNYTLFWKFSLRKVNIFCLGGEHFPGTFFPEYCFLLFSNLFLQNFRKKIPRNREN